MSSDDDCKADCPPEILRSCKPLNMELHDYQVAITSWMVKHPKQKGLIVDLGTGLGKSLLSANLGESLVTLGRVKNILVITPKSLVGNFKKAVKLCLNTSAIPARYHIFSYEEYRIQKPYLDDFVLIVDEAHNIRNSDTARSKDIFQACKLAKHVLALTATPFINGSADMSPLMRLMLPESEWSAFPLDQAAFDKLYDDHPDHYLAVMKNHIAHYHELAGTFPKVTRHVNEIELSSQQVELIDDIKNKNLSPKLQKLMAAQLAKGQMPSDGRINAFLTRVRQVSNGIVGDDGEHTSPKVQAIVETLMNGPKPCLIYSQFVEYGVNLIRDALIKQGEDPAQIGSLTGCITKAKREQLIERYNEGRLKYLMFTQAGCEGISTKATRQIHHIETDWNPSRTQQVDGRGIRLDSHTHLPKAEQHVDVYTWISIYSDDTDAVIAPDVRLWNISLQKKGKIDLYHALNKQASIPLELPKPPPPPPAPKKKNSSKKKKKRSSKKSKRSKSKCSGHMPPCTESCHRVKESSYVTKKGNSVTRRAHCRK